MTKFVTDAQALSFVAGQAYRINPTVYATRYPDWDFSRLVFVDSSGGPWDQGVITYSSDESGKAEFITGYAKDMPFADVSQSRELRKHQRTACPWRNP